MASQSAPNPADTVSVAVAGLGTIAQTVHLPLLERLGNRYRITALADLSPAQLRRTGERYGVPAGQRFTDVGRMLEHGGFNAVLLLTSGSHVPDSLEALRRGYTVLAEKPLGYAHGELDTLLPADGADAHLAGRLMVGYMKQYDPAVQRLAQLLDKAGGPAAVHSIEVTVLHPSAGAQLDFARLPPPAGDIEPATLAALSTAQQLPLVTALGADAAPEARTLYGITMNSVCHELSLIRLLAGAPAAVDHAALWRAPSAGEGDPPSAELSGALADGGRYGIRWLYQPDYPAYRETVTVHHATGSLELVFPSPYLLNVPTTLTETGGRHEAEHRTVHRAPTGGFEAELVAFHELVTRGTPPLSGVREAAADITFAQQAVARLAAAHGLTLSGEAAHA
ncbi:MULTISPECIES: Gfo/Idh/MocA family protein [unclassified Streptomyces]|uniref:Gfo/Idh/MocA family protein n=1 Tax=unclassified Streptomyces TaxID=2593676 RepID=UPI000CD5B9DF|nr:MULTISPECIES: Gfo/Idh/MocA family oxidoreductase [unclassified Streptomyces]